AQSTLNDLITNVVTNTVFVLGAAAVAGFVIGFLSWLMADLVVLYFASAAANIIQSFPFYGLLLNVLTDAINPLLTAFPVVGQLVSAGTQLVQSFTTAFFWPANLTVQILRALSALVNPLGQTTAS
ncbi:hypothetical protein, partial [Mycobacterium sp. E796]